MSDRFTIIFDGDIRQLPFNPFVAHDSKFGNVVGCCRGSALTENDRLEAEIDRLRLAAKPVLAFMRLWLSMKAAGMTRDTIRGEMLEPMMKDLLEAFEEVKP